MTQLRDPDEIYREALARVPRAPEEHPPVIERAEAWPYPDLRRVWVRLQTSPFEAYPNVALVIQDPDGAVVSSMFLVEIRESYQSLTLHLRQPPRPAETYRLVIELSRDEAVLDTGEFPFELTFREPESTLRNSPPTGRDFASPPAS